MKAMKKILSLVLCFMLLVSAVPVHAFAAEEGNVTNGAYQDGVWTAGGSGSIIHNIDGYEVELSKTATPVDGMENTYDITVQVKTEMHHKHFVPDGAVVLVFDESNSMDYCASCGGGAERLWWEGRHESGCQYSGSVRDSQSRMYAAKAAARDFLATYAGTDANAKRMLALVTFGTNRETELNWVNVAGGPGKNGYNTALAAINDLATNGGTNLEAGLYQALQELGKDAISAVKSPSVVLLTDGAPTYRMSGNGGVAGDGSSGSAQNNSAAANRAEAIKNSGANIYSVCFGVADDRTYSGGPTIGNFLAGDIASGSDYAYDADHAGELMDAFKAITEDIVEGLDVDGWTVTDPMPANVDVIGDLPTGFAPEGKEYTWTLHEHEEVDHGDDTTYIYSITYRITLDVQEPGFVEGQFYPANEPTTLNHGDEHFAFPVPGIKGVLPRTDVSVTKVWDDGDNRDGLRTDSVTLQLHKDGVALGQPVVLSNANDWSHTWTDLIEMSGGVEHAYTVVETDVEGYKPVYTANGTALTVTNVHVSETKDITVTKVWEDGDNQDGKRPASIQVQLLADGEPFGEAVTLAGDSWSYTWKGLFVKENGADIEYSVAEVAVPEDYTSSVEDFVITNTYEPETIDIAGSKTWNDGDDQDGLRPDSIIVNLLADSEIFKTVTVTEADNWAWSFTDLPKYNAGVEIEYAIQEVEVEGYETVVEGYNITNTHTPETLDISGAKTWNDNDDQDGLRPDSITVKLLAGGEVFETVTVTEADNWAWSFTNLPKYSNGAEIEYTIQEVDVNGYTTEVDGYNITNTHTPEVVTVEGKKTWNDGNDQDGLRPDSITVNLLADGETIETVTVTEAEGWAWSFTNLPKYNAGNEIEYTITEDAVEGYTTEVNGYNITNTYTPEVVTVEGKKTWNDANDQDGLRPENIVINLLANGKTVEVKAVTEADGWAWSFTDLPKYENGVEIKYSIEEIKVEGYEVEINGYDVTNTHTPETLDISGTKTWEDEDNRDGIRPETITVNLLADGQVVKTATVSEAEQWSWSFTDLPKYAAGEEIEYTVEEIEVEGYTTEIDGFNITNTHVSEVKNITATKVWDDAEDQDGKRPESIKVQLLADGEPCGEAVTITGDSWSYTWEDLYVYANGEEIVYTVEELDVPEDYDSSVEDFVITNSHKPETIDISGSKTWEDADDQDGIRPETITVKLFADGELVKEAVVGEAEGWAWSFTDLPKFANGAEIAYTIEEEAVEGYEATVNGFDIVNTHVPGTVGVEVKKVWNDNSDMYKIRPASVTIVLVADGVETDKTLKLNAENSWAGSFTDLPEKAAGKAIVYTVKELDVEGYGSSVSGDAAKGFTVTNDLILIPETGDETNILGYGLVMGISFIALIAVIVLMINDKKRYNK